MERRPALVALGEQLKRFRLAKDKMIQAKLASLTGYSEGQISGVETGQNMPSREFLARCDKALDTCGALVAMYDMIRWTDHPVQSFDRYAEAESVASEIHTYQALAVHGLLQTVDYARALLVASLPNAKPDTIDALLSARLERQVALSGESPPDLYLIMDETVLRRVVGGTKVQRGQLDRLIEAATQPGITIQVVPLDTGGHAGLTSSFTILSFKEAPTIAYSEDPASGHLHEKPETVRVMWNTYNAVRANALPVNASLELMKKIREEL